MNPLQIAKAAVDLVVSAGAGAVVGNAIKASTPLDAKAIQKIVIGVGGLTLSGLVGSQASQYAGQQIDSTLSQIQAVKAAFHKK